ncbi:MAG: hypothetical protein IKY13_07060, partial [Bacteroidaceae bacterium]|nr:hypothetical protein [Bacteroidaceae bacterium]
YNECGGEMTISSTPNTTIAKRTACLQLVGDNETLVLPIAQLPTGNNEAGYISRFNINSKGDSLIAGVVLDNKGTPFTINIELKNG